jgi:hypothetical protein
MPRRVSARVDTHLSQHLVEHGLLAADALEDALQKQLAHGGALDTILLETGELDEVRLSDALAAAWGTGSLSVERVTRPDPHAAKRLPARMAMNLGLCPLFVDDAGVHVATKGPLDRQLIEEVSSMIDATLVPHVVPEVRLTQALSAAYDVSPDERMVALLTRLELHRTGKSPPPILSHVDEALTLDALEGAEAPTGDWDLVEALAHLVAQESRAGIAEVVVNYARRFLPFAAVFGIRDGNAVGWGRSGPCEGVQFEVPLPVPTESILAQVISSPSPFIGKPPINDGNAVVFGWMGRRRPWTALLIPIVVAGRTVGALYGDGGVRSRDFESLSDLVAFGARVGPAFEALLRARHRARSEPARGDGRDGTSPFARGYVAPATSDLPEDDAPVVDERPKWTTAEVISTAPPSPVPSSLTSAPASEDEGPSEDDFLDVDMDEDLDDVEDQLDAEPEAPAEDEARSVEEALAAAAAAAEADADMFAFEDEPLPEPDVVVGSVVTDAEDVTDAEEATDLDEDADEDLQVVHRLPSSLSGEGEPVVEVEPAEPAPEPVAVSNEPLPELLRDDGWEDVRLDEAYLSALSEDRPPDPAPEATEDDNTEPARIEPATAPPIPPSEWVERLYSRKTETAARAIDALVAFGAGALPTLRRVFPGRLRIDPFDAGPEPVAALQFGPVVEVLARLGAIGLEVAADNIESRSRVDRYVATFLYLTNGDESHIRTLRPRLHDAEPRIQELAAKALSRFLASPDFEPEILAHLRARLDSPVFDARERAIRLLGLFRDPRAVPMLVGQLGEKSGELEQQALGSLRLITLRDFGPRARPWKRWWSKAKHRPRIEWLLEGLRSKSEDLRKLALKELIELTGDDFGYRVEGRKGARDKAAAKFDEWWDKQREALFSA